MTETNRPRSVLQSWVEQLGLRHQGLILTAIRGCDTAPKEDASKALTRCYRAATLNAFVGDPAKARTFIEAVDVEELAARMDAFRRNLDHYPHHYVMHLIHAAEVVGYKHPEPLLAAIWCGFYIALCQGLHVQPESEVDMDARLTAAEDDFADANGVEAPTRYRGLRRA